MNTQKLKAGIYLIGFIIGVTLIIWLLSNIITQELDQVNTDQTNNVVSESQSQTTETSNSDVAEETANSENTEVSESDTANSNSNDEGLPVTVIKANNLETSYYDSVGTVKSSNAISVYPATAGAVARVNFKEGDLVEAEDVLLDLTGTNFSEHPIVTQKKIAQASLDNALLGLSNLQKTSNENLTAAELQLASAVNQAKAINYDLAIIEQNKQGLDDSLNLLSDSLRSTQDKNDLDRRKAADDLNELLDDLDDLYDEKEDTEDELDDAEDELRDLENYREELSGKVDDENSANPAGEAGADNSAQIAALKEKIAGLEAALEQQENAIDQMEDGIEQAKYGLNLLQEGTRLSENQILAQIVSAENQQEVLDLNLISTKTKLGYDGQVSDPLKLAEQGYNSTVVQLKAAVDSASQQVKLASLNYQLASNQAKALEVKAPLTGIITMLDSVMGENVSPQAPIAEIIDPKSFELDVEIDSSIADKLASSKDALVFLGNYEISVPIKSVGLKVNAQTKMTKVTLSLPNIFFKVNQYLKVKLPLRLGNTGGKNLFLPLDAVIIGTESKFVYLYDNGVAKQFPVELGEIVDDQVEILTPIDPQAQIILSGAKGVLDGQKVTIIESN